ncbi:MAG: glycoside hydrolase family 9 protein [Candidatus Aureabacteria bacterium]|nr:glycoside hydrolase family 9 protein [Candidatus Auribacterota bacterium]
MRRLLTLAVIPAVISSWVALFPCSGYCDAGEYRLPVFTSDLNISDAPFWEDSWIGSGDGCEIDHRQNRISMMEDDEGARVLSFKGSNPGSGWWFACIARPMWQPFYLEGYKEVALLEFSVNCEDGQCPCLIGIADKSRLKREAVLDLKKYMTARGGWQKIRIPVSDFCKINSGMDFSRISHIILKGNGSPGKFSISMKEIEFRAGDILEEIYPVIKINQCGYRPCDIKVAKISGREMNDFGSKTFYVLDEKTGDRAFEGKICAGTAADADSGDMVFDADFSDLKTPGRYRISIGESNIKSPVFCIDRDVYNGLLVDSLRMFYLQRCGTSVNSSECRHNPCHMEDAMLLSEKSKEIEATGGWHDAGDYGKYIVNAGVSVGTLLYAYELFPEKFFDGQVNIPESSNGVPDILDEARWEVEWFLKMQRADGGVYHKLAGVFQLKACPPDLDCQPRYIIDLSAVAPGSDKLLPGSVVSTTATANFAAVCALAARMFDVYDEDFSRECLFAAEKAWEFLKKHPQDYPARGFCNPPLKDPFIVSGEYGDDPEGDWTQGDKDERFWASVELFRSTGNDKYHDYVKDNYTGFKNAHAINWQQLQNLGLYSYCLCPGADERVKYDILEGLEVYGKSILMTAENNAYNVALNDYEYYWGSSAVALNYAVDMLFIYELSGEDQYLETAQSQLHYVLGRNVLSMSFVSGYGENSVGAFYHNWFNSSLAADSYPRGFLVGGPNKDNFRISDFPARCYKPVESDFTINEPAINYNAPLVFASSFFSEK